MKIRALLLILTLMCGNFFATAAAHATDPSWTKIYELTDPLRNSSGGYSYSPNYGLNTGDAADLYKASGLTFDKIRYRMEITISGTLYFVDVSFDKWANNLDSSTTLTEPTIDNLQIPTGAGGTGNIAIQTNVRNLSIQSNFPGISGLASAVITGTGLVGRLEIWPSCYGAGISHLSPAGSDSLFDFDDSGFSDTSFCYGSFQVHDLTNMQTVFAVNYGGQDIGLGNCIYTGAQPDWTFSSRDGISLLNRQALAPAHNPWQLQIFVSNAASSNYQINFDANGGSPSTSANFSQNSNALQTLPVQPTRENYSFIGWSSDSVTPISSYQVTGPATLFALWHLNAPTIASAAISGTTRVGETLSASAVGTTGLISNRSFKWQRSERGSSGFSDIAGATSPTYLLLPRDSEKFIRVVVTVNNNSGSATATSIASSKIAEPSRADKKEEEKKPEGGKSK